MQFLCTQKTLRRQIPSACQEGGKKREKQMDNLPLASWKPHPPHYKELSSRKNLTKALRSECEYGALCPLPQQYRKGTLERIIGEGEGGWKSRRKRLAVAIGVD